MKGHVYCGKCGGIIIETEFIASLFLSYSCEACKVDSPEIKLDPRLHYELSALIHRIEEIQEQAE